MKSQELRKIAPELDPLRIGTGWKVEELEKIYHQDAESIYKDIMTIVDKKRQENKTI